MSPLFLIWLEIMGVFFVACGLWFAFSFSPLGKRLLAKYNAWNAPSKDERAEMIQHEAKIRYIVAETSRRHPDASAENVLGKLMFNEPDLRSILLSSEADSEESVRPPEGS